MKNAVFLLFLLRTLTVSAQQSILNGTVTVFNSQFETGKKQYVANAQVEEDYGKSQAATTNTEGVFKLPLVGINDLDKVFFNVKKANYEIVNTDALQAVAGQKEAVQVFMALEGVLAENKRKYYQINRTASEKAVTEKLVQVGQQIEILQQNKAANQSKIEDLQAEYGRLQESIKKIDETARELAERYAKTNLDDASAEYQRAFRYFQRGLLDSALFVFQKMDLEQTAQKVASEQNRTAALKTEYETRNTDKNKQKGKAKEALLFKAQLHQIQYEFVQTQNCYELLLRLDSTDIDVIKSFSDFLAVQGLYDKSIVYYKKTINISKEDKTKAIAYNSLANVYHLNKDTTAEDAYLQSLMLYETLSKKNKAEYLPIIAIISDNLGSYYRDIKRFDEAGKFLTQSLKIYKKLTKKDQEVYLPNLALSYNSMGRYYYDRKKMLKAYKYFDISIDLYQKLADLNTKSTLPIQIPVTIQTYYALQIEYYYNVKLRDELEMRVHKSSPLIKKKINKKYEYLLTKVLNTHRQLATRSPDVFLPFVGVTLINLGNVYYNQYQIDKAEKTYQEALQIHRDLARKNSNAFLPFVAQTLGVMANFYLTRKHADKAKPLLEEALKIYKDLSNYTPNAYKTDITRIEGFLTEMRNSNQKSKQ